MQKQLEDYSKKDNRFRRELIPFIFNKAQQALKGKIKPVAFIGAIKKKEGGKVKRRTFMSQLSSLGDFLYKNNKKSKNIRRVKREFLNQNEKYAIQLKTRK